MGRGRKGNQSGSEELRNPTSRHAKREAFRKSRQQNGAFMTNVTTSTPEEVAKDKSDPSNATESGDPGGSNLVPPELRHLFPGYDFELLGNTAVRSFMYSFRQPEKNGERARLFDYIDNFPFSDVFCTPTRLMGKDTYEASVPPPVPRVPALLVMEVNQAAYYLIRDLFKRTLRDIDKKKVRIMLPEDPQYLFNIAHETYKNMLRGALRNVINPFNVLREAFNATEQTRHAANMLFVDVLGRNLQVWVLAHELFYFKIAKVINYMEFYLNEENVQKGLHYPISKPFSLISKVGMEGELCSNTFYFFDRLYHFTGYIEIYTWEDLSDREKLANWIHYGKFNERFYGALMRKEKELRQKVESPDSEFKPHDPSTYRPIVPLEEGEQCDQEAYTSSATPQETCPVEHKEPQPSDPTPPASSEPTDRDEHLPSHTAKEEEASNFQSRLQDLESWADIQDDEVEEQKQ